MARDIGELVRLVNKMVEQGNGHKLRGITIADRIPGYYYLTAPFVFANSRGVAIASMDHKEVENRRLRDLQTPEDADRMFAFSAQHGWSMNAIRCEFVELPEHHVLKIDSSNRLVTLYKKFSHHCAEKYEHHSGIAYPMDPLFKVGMSMYQGVTKHVLFNGTDSIVMGKDRNRPNSPLLDKGIIPGVFYDVEAFIREDSGRPKQTHFAKPVPLTRLVAPPIQEAITHACFEADDHRVAYGSWADGEVIAKRVHEEWMFEGKRVELYWVARELYEEGRIYKSTLNAVTKNLKRISIDDTRYGRNFFAEKTAYPRSYYDVWVMPDDEPEFKVRLNDDF